MAYYVSSQASRLSDNTYHFDDDALCDEFDFLNNLTDSDDQLSPEGIQYVFPAQIFSIIMLTPSSNPKCDTG